MENAVKKVNITTSIVPWISVPDILKAVNFYKSAFAATEVYRLEAPDGSLQVSRLSVDGAEFWLGEETFQNSFENKSGSISVRMILTVADPHSIFSQALKAGAAEVFPVGEEHGWRLGRLIDPFGMHWEIGHPLI